MNSIGSVNSQKCRTATVAVYQLVSPTRLLGAVKKRLFAAGIYVPQSQDQIDRN
jgi:hypothetical protein